MFSRKSDVWIFMYSLLILILATNFFFHKKTVGTKSPQLCAGISLQSLQVFVSSLDLGVQWGQRGIYFFFFVGNVMSLLFIFLNYYYYFLLWWILSYIEMKQPWVYMCSPSRYPLPPPSPPDPSRSSQCTRSERLSHASNLGW